MSVEDMRIECFQLVLLCLLGVNYIIVAMCHASPTFYNYAPPFYCISSNGANKSYGCVMNATSKPPNQITRSLCISEYIFLTEYGERSIITDWGLICERSFLKSISAIAHHLGIAIGAWISGILIDRIGRLPVLAISLYIQGTITVAIYTVQSYPMFLTMSGLQGLFAQGLQISTYISSVELFPAKFRTLVATVMNIFWALGLLLIGGLSYIIPDWRILQLAISVPTATTVLYIWIIPESPRWLSMKGKTTEADIVLERMEEYNACGRRKSSGKGVRKPQVLSTEVDDKDGTKVEMYNLLVSDTADSCNSKKISLRQIPKMLEKRVTNKTDPETNIQVFDMNLHNDREISLHQENVRDPEIVLSPDESTSQANEDETCFTKVSEQTKEKITKEIKNRNIDNERAQVESVKTFRCGRILNNGSLIKYSTIMACQWCSLSMTKFMVIHLIPNLVDNRHMNFAISSMMELIIYVFIYFILSRYGRRLPMGVGQTLNGVICILIVVLAFSPHITELWRGTIVLLWLSRATTAGTLAILYLYTVEIFPTIIRGTCVGLCVVVDGICGIGISYILSLTNNVSMVPLMFAGIMSFLSAPLNLLLPETLDDLLPDTFFDMMTLGNRKKCISNIIEETASEQGILRERLFSDDWVDAGNGIIVNFPEIKN